MSRARLLAACLAVAIPLGPALAVQPDEILPDRGLEGRARAISAEMRCVVCQNQSIDDSDAPLARDLRLLVRERLKAGDSDAAVRTFVADRYGAFVLLKPPVSGATLVLWFAPATLVLGALAALLAARRSGSTSTISPALSAEEERQVAALLERREA